MEGCWRRLKESRWKVAGVAIVVAAVLAVGATAQHQLSHTSLAVSLPLGDLAAVASSGQEDTISEASHATDNGNGSTDENHRVAPPEDASNEVLHITPVKLTQAGTVEALDGAPQNLDTLTSEADEPFFIVVNDVAADPVNNSPPVTYEEPQADTHVPDDGTEAPLSSEAEVHDVAINPSDKDTLSTQHSLNAVDEADQSISSLDNDAEIIDPLAASGERGAKAIEAIAPADADFFPQPLAEDSIFEVEQSFDVLSEEVFTESTPASTLSIEAQFQDLSLRAEEALPTEATTPESFSDITTDDALPTGPSATDSQDSPQISFEAQTRDEVHGTISAEEQTTEPNQHDILTQEPSPAPIPVRISLGGPISDAVLATPLAEEATLGQVPHEVPEVTTQEGARESHDLKVPQTQLETGVAEVKFPGFENTDKSSPESHDPTQLSSDIQISSDAPTGEAPGDSVSHPVTGNIARLVEIPPTAQLPASGNGEERVAKLNEAAAAAASAGAAAADSTTEPHLEVGRVSNYEVLLVQELPQGTGRAPENTVDPFAPQIEHFNPDPPITAEELAVVPEWIAEDSVSGEIFDHSDAIELPDLPMDDIEVFFLAEDPQAEEVLAEEVQGVAVTEVKQQLHKDEVHIAALPDAVPFSPGEGQVTPQVQEAVKDALEAEIAAMGAFGMKVPSGTAAAAIPPAPAPTPAHFAGAAPASGPPQTFEIDTTFNPASKPIFEPAPVHTPTVANAPVQQPPPQQEAPHQNSRPAPAKVQKPAAPPLAPPYNTPTPAPVQHVTDAPAYISPAPAITHPSPSTSQTYRPAPEPTHPRPKPTRPRPKPARPTYQPQPEPTRPPYRPRPRPTRPPYRPTKPPAPTTHPPTTAAPPLQYKPGQPPISYVSVKEPKPEHFRPPSYQGPIPHLPVSYDDLTSPPRHPIHPSSPSLPRPAPPPTSYKPQSSYSPHSSTSYKPPSTTSYKPPSSSYKPPSSTYTQRRPPSYKPRPSITHPPAAPYSSQYRPPLRPKPPSHPTKYEKPLITTSKPLYRPVPTTPKPHKTQKPILAPVLVPAHLSGIVFPKGVTFSGHHKTRPPSLFHLPSFFRTERKQRLQVPESVVSRLDSDQPDWVADLEPERR